MKEQKGFTLIEILIVLALMAVLMAIVIPNVQGFLGRGKQDAYNSDRKTLQVAVDGYYTAAANRTTFPTKNGASGVPTFSANAYMDTDLLIDGKYINELPASANVFNKTGATGTYGWYVDTNGRVQSLPTYTAGVYP
ncbi:MAG: type II secretion system protein [Dehalococcoidia bacterium]|nr:type II secretion system protein [Dehalococcoidia bacterium]